MNQVWKLYGKTPTKHLSDLGILKRNGETVFEDWREIITNDQNISSQI